MQEQKTERISVADLNDAKEKPVLLKGWVYNIRSSGKIGFLLLRDGSGICQCILNASFSSLKSFEVFKSLQQENVVEVKGVVKAWKNSFEIQVQELKKTGTSEAYPLGKKDHGIDFLLQHRHLWLRSKRPWAILRIRHEITKAIHAFFNKNNFLQIESPVLTPNACEGSSTLFPVQFFNEDEIYLSQSGQFYMEAAAAAFGKVYCFNPVFRAEKSSTRRHLLEFWMIEPEMAFYDLEQTMELAEDMITFIVSQVLKNNVKELEILKRNTQLLEKIKPPFARIHYTEAAKILIEKKNSKFQMGQDFGGEDETLLSSHFEKPVFVHHYPSEIKAFYMKTDQKSPDFSLSFDLLGTEGYGELVGGSQREDDLEMLEDKMKQHKVEKESLNWYLDLRRYGSFPHSGFGVGLERVVSWICGLTHVREAIAFPRLYARSFFEKQN